MIRSCFIGIGFGIAIGFYPGIDLQADRTHELQRVALAHDAGAQAVVEGEHPVPHEILEMDVFSARSEGFHDVSQGKILEIDIMRRLRGRGEFMGGLPARPSTRRARLFYLSATAVRVWITAHSERTQ